MNSSWSYEDFEATLILASSSQGWQFMDNSEVVAPELVFNRQTYAPAVLKTAEDDLRRRGIDVDLGLSFQPCEDALMGFEVHFKEEQLSEPAVDYSAMLWRLCLAMHVVKHLPLNQGYRDLTVLALSFDSMPVAEPN